jgi:hypothetical protein
MFTSYGIGQAAWRQLLCALLVFVGCLGLLLLLPTRCIHQLQAMILVATAKGVHSSTGSAKYLQAGVCFQQTLLI